jgi:hypothetical protein
VPLSEHEQRLLEQMERALYAEDPKFASSLRSAGPRPGNRRKAAIGVLTLLVGMGLLIAGPVTSIVALGVVGFVVMLVGTMLVISAMRAEPAEATAATAAAAPGSPAPKQAKAQKSGGFMDRVEERFRKRREGDDS